ncbi:MAG TPA: response regulator [Sandaracinaceae bacterium LLY-WYZ-13_1]|nr:response regulator [Sandaracinaceae bacterium LLY-WYZ-13_1]
MDREALTRRLRAVFVEELEDHVAGWNAALLALERGADPPARAEHVHTLFRIAHSLKGASRAVHLPELESYCHALEESLDALRESGEAPDDALLSRLFEAADTFAEVARRLHADEAVDASVFERPAPTAPGVPAPGESPPMPGDVASNLKVPAARLDALLVRAGELSRMVRRLEERDRACARLIARIRARRSEAADKTPYDAILEELYPLHAALQRDLGELTRVVHETDADVRQLRLTPFADACASLERVVRDAGRERGREARLRLDGAEVEIDRSVSASLRAPLVHIVRNAVAHGIEPPEAREDAGKPRAGTVRVGAELRGSEVRVTVSDDGRGLDLEALATRARAKGMEPPSDPGLLARLVFVPGLSTSGAVDRVSGRGVGLDVVKREVEGFHGTVDVATEPGRGTTFTLSVPLTRTVVRALLVRVGERRFAIPSTNVLTLKRIDPAAVHLVDGRPVVLHEGAPLAFRSLASVLGMRAPTAAAGLVSAVVLQSARDRVVFRVEELRSVEDVVVEPLGPRLPRVRHLAGATTLPDGTLAPILHVGDLVRSALRRTGERPEVPAAPEAREPPTLLVVDDSLTTLALEKTILESAGYRVLGTTDGERALQILAEAEVDLVVSDVEMPRMDGLGLTRALRSSNRTRAVPIVLLTGLSREEDRQRGLRAGADAYLVKNAFDQSELLAEVERLLSS